VVAVEVGALGEGQSVEPVGGEEDAVLEHPLRLEPRSQRGQVDVVLGGSDLLRVVRPVVGLDREAGLGGERSLLAPGVAGGRGRHPGEHLADGGRSAGGVVLGHQLGVVGEPEQLRPLRPQPEHVECDLPGVVSTAAAPPRALRLRQPAPDVAVGERREVRVSGGKHEGEQPLPVQSPRRRGRRRC
jgi:hypothetical protein